MRFPLDPSHMCVNDLEEKGANVTQEQELAAIAREDVDVALEALNRRSEGQGCGPGRAPRSCRRGVPALYRASAGEQFVLDDHDMRFRFIRSSAAVDRSPHRVSSRRRRELQCRSF